MCGGGPKPQPAKPTPVAKPTPQPKPAPTVEKEPIAAGPAEDTFAKKRSQGRRKTILTSSLGIGEDPNVARKTLLGS